MWLVPRRLKAGAYLQQLHRCLQVLGELVVELVYAVSQLSLKPEQMRRSAK